MGEFDLPVCIRQQPSLGTLQHTELAALEARGMTLGHDPVTAGFDTDHADIFLTEERVKHADRIGSAAHASNEHIR